MADEYTPTMAELRMDWSRVRGSAFDPEAQARQAELESLFDRALAAHDAEIRRDQAEKTATEVIDWCMKSDKFHASSMLEAARARFLGVPAEKLSDWTVTLTPSNGKSHGFRHVRVTNCPDWDTAIEMAEKVHPGWQGLSAGPFVSGTGLTFGEDINVRGIRAQFTPSPETEQETE